MLSRGSRETCFSLPAPLGEGYGSEPGFITIRPEQVDETGGCPINSYGELTHRVQCG